MLIRTHFPKKTVFDSTSLIADATRVGFDIETDGLYLERGARIREFAVVDHGGLRLGWSGVDTPGLVLTPSLLARLLDNLRGHLVVGHNITFDLKFLAAETDRNGQYCPNFYGIDTLGLSRKFLGQKCHDFHLTGVANYLGITAPDTLHRAEPDAQLALAVFEKLWERFDLITLADAGVQRFVL